MNTSIKNVHVIIAKFISRTNTLEYVNKIIISSEHFNQSVTIPFETDHGNDTCEIAEHWLTEKGFQIIGHSAGKDVYYIISDTFEPLKPAS